MAHPRYSLYLRPSAPNAPTEGLRHLVSLVCSGTNKKWGGGHVTLCSFTATDVPKLVHCAKKARAAAQQLNPARGAWRPAEKSLKWYETGPDGWVMVTFGESSTLKAICDVVRQSGLGGARQAADLHFTIGSEGTAAKLQALGLGVPPRGKENAGPVPVDLRNYLCKTLWSIVVARVPQWPHDDPYVAELRESVELRWKVPQGESLALKQAVRPLREPITDAFVWDPLRETFEYMDVRRRSFKFGEVKLSGVTMDFLDDLFDNFDTDGNGLIDLRDFQSRAPTKEKGKELWDQFRRWCFSGMNIVDCDYPNLSIDRREFMRSLKRDILRVAKGTKFSPREQKLTGSSFLDTIAFLKARMNDIAHKQGTSLRTTLMGSIEAGSQSRSADLFLSDSEDEHAVMFWIPVTAAASQDLKSLFQKFDVNRDGVISEDDFSTPGQLRVWSELREELDPDGDGKGRWGEFMTSFRRRVVDTALNFHNSNECTLVGAVQRLVEAASIGIRNRVREIETLCGYHKGTVESEGPLEVKVGSVQVEQIVVSKIMKLFGQLDHDSSGGIELADLQARLKGDASKAESQYKVLFESFDADRDGKVTMVEFVTKIVHHVAKMPADAVPGELTVEEQVKLINTSLNRQINSQCESLKHFFGLA